MHAITAPANHASRHVAFGSRKAAVGRHGCGALVIAVLLGSTGCGQARFEERLKIAVANAATEMAKQGLSPQEKAEMEQKLKAQGEARARALEQRRKRGGAPPAAAAPPAGAAAPPAPTSEEKKPQADYPTPAARAILAPPDPFE